MFDLEAAADRMRAANSGGVKRYCFYLRDTLPHSGGYFFWYDGKDALNDGLINDLVGFVYSDPKEEGIKEFLVDMKDCLDLAQKDNYSFPGVLLAIDKFWKSYTTQWQICFIGSYDMLCQSDGAFESSIRSIFRDGREPSDEEFEKGIKPITTSEEKLFSECLSDPMWMAS